MIRRRYDRRAQTRPFGTAASAAVLLPALVLCSCAGPLPAPKAEEQVAAAIGLDRPVEFRVEGGSNDEVLASDRLTRADAIRLAVTNDPELQAALARVRIAMADAGQARLLPNPVLDLVLRFGGDGSPGVEVSLAQDFVQILQQRRRSSAADNRMRRAALEAVTTALDTVQEVEERYAEAQALDRLAITLEEQRGLLRRVLEVARNRLAVGEGTRPDVTTLESQQSELEVELADSSVRRRASRLRLAREIGAPSGAADWVLDDAAPLPSPLPPEKDWIDAGLAHRPEIEAGVWGLAALGDDAALARLFAFEGASAGVDAERDGGDWTAGPVVSMPIPIFDMGQARRERITAEMIEARHNLTLAKRRTIEEVRIAYQALLGAEANLKRVRNELLPLQALRRDQAETAFRAGQSDVTLLFLAERDIRATQARAAALEQEAQSALARLFRAVGGSGVAAKVLAAKPQQGISQTEPMSSPATATTPN